MTGPENATCKLLPGELPFKGQPPLLEKIAGRGGRRVGDRCRRFFLLVCPKMQSGGGNRLSSASFLAAEGMNWFTGKVLGFWGGGEQRLCV